MTLEEAIEGNETIAKDLDFRGYETQAQSVRLGREALKRIRLNRTVTRHPYKTPLPGETKE